VDLQYQVPNSSIRSAKLRSRDRWPMIGRGQEQQFISNDIADPDRSGVRPSSRDRLESATRLIHKVLRWSSDHQVEWITASEPLCHFPSVRWLSSFPATGMRSTGRLAGGPRP
jgi:hypothetical protein